MPSTGHGTSAPNATRVLVTPADMRDPWMSVYGFPTIAGRLAGGEELLLVCCRDELSAFVNQLNLLVGAPATLQRAGAMVRQMTAGTRTKLRELIAVELLPPSAGDAAAIARAVDAMLSERTVDPDLAEQLACLIEPTYATQKLQGLARQLAHFESFHAALRTYEHVGFAVEASEGERRSFTRNGTPSLHATLWQYGLRRRS